MTEQLPHPPPEPSPPEAGVDPDQIGAALRAEPVSIRDGFRFDLGAERADLTLELYPAAGQIFIHARDLRLSAGNLATPIIVGSDRIRIASADDEAAVTQIMLTADGEVALLLSPETVSEDPESLRNAVSPARRTETPPNDQRRKSAPVADHRDDAAPAATPPPVAREQETDQRVTLTGVLLTLPTFKRSPKRQRFIAEFDIQIQSEDNSSTVEHVVLFDGRAHQLEQHLDTAALGVGDPLEVIGYTRVNRRGKEIYGVHVRHRGDGS